jgi:Cdc6-like AAA superfamily ATPase
MAISKTLRGYQADLYRRVNRARNNGKDAVMLLPTGAGKTAIARNHCSHVLNHPNHNDYPICGDKIWKLHHIQYVKVRQDILDDLYAAIEEVADQAGRGEDIRFGNVLQLADELKANKRYSEMKVIK